VSQNGGSSNLKAAIESQQALQAHGFDAGPVSSSANKRLHPSSRLNPQRQVNNRFFGGGSSSSPKSSTVALESNDNGCSNG